MKGIADEMQSDRNQNGHREGRSIQSSKLSSGQSNEASKEIRSDFGC